MTHTDIQTAIRLSLEDWAIPPEEINGGLCGDFVDFVCHILDQPNMPEGFEIWGTPPPAHLIPDGCCPCYPFGHTWIVKDGVHYDAEVPQGVEHASKLPIFKRYRVWRKERAKGGRG